MPRCKVCGEKIVPVYSHHKGKDIYRHDHHQKTEKNQQEKKQVTKFPKTCPHCNTEIDEDVRNDATYSLECPVCERQVFKRKVEVGKSD